jgi:hypothetical protein
MAHPPCGPVRETNMAFLELFKEWWLWGGIVALIVLVVLFIKMRKPPDDD